MHTMLVLYIQIGVIGGYNYTCAGIRPVVTMTDGVYIKSGDGTEGSPYILGKD